MIHSRVLRGLRSFSRAGELFRCIEHTPQWDDVIQGYIGLKRLNWPYEFHLRNGHTIELDDWNDLTTVWAVLFGDEYRVGGDDEIVVDLGANIGAFTVMAAAAAPRATIFAVEPFPANFSRLEACVARNSLQDRVRCRQAAITGQDGTVTMDGAPDIPSHSRMITSTDKASSPVVMQGISLQTLFEQERLTHIDYLKMDIEGAEFDVIEHAPVATLRQAKVIGLEVHGAPSGFGVLWEKLKTAGFVERRLARRPFWMTVEFERL
ncbi:FkbM family methyltransferase [Rhodopseudomonas sp. NSM]|uniref:FkbM family methyltransferase n=1 Tax=Rhodopseudomonas sp. NSM TaxID=3457630 RepID=UPI0040358487